MANSKISALTSATTPLAGTEVLPIVQSSATVKVATNDLTVRNIRASATTGILQVTGPLAATTRVMTTPDANFTVARTDAGQTFTGNQVIVGSGTFGPATGNGYVYSQRSSQSTGQVGYQLNGGTSSTDWLIYLAVNSDTLNIFGNSANRIQVDTSGNVTVNTGNLVIGTSGKGIDFSATPGTGTSELFADYEEGTWTATITAAVGTGYTTAVYAARYTKFGRLVTVTLNVQVTAAGTASGVMNISGLPFTAVANINPVGSCYESASGVAYLVRGAASAATATITTTAGLGIVWAYATQYFFTMTYEAA